jgi:DNA primase
MGFERELIPVLFLYLRMSRIEPYIIDQIKLAADVVEVIGDYVSLKKKGGNYWACCPFHGEKSPSFSVSAPKGIYKCFGCGKAGDAVRFVMDIEGLTYPEALRHLAKKYGIEIVESEQSDEQQIQQNERESLYLMLDYAKDYYRKFLFETDEGQNIGLSYFKERGFNEATIKSFDLGHSPSSWDALTTDALTAGYSIDILEKSGLTIVKKDSEEADAKVKTYDRFRARVMFPIHNASGKVIAFGGRILKADKNQPKYVNSPETDIYHKSDVLYGIFQAKAAIRSTDTCYLCEGYTDVVSLHQAGIHNVVASSGTSLTQGQIKLISRFTQNIIILYDGDPAGIKASLRGMDLILEEGLNVKLATFPEGEDPDSYVRKIGSEAFVDYIQKQAKDFISFKAELGVKDAGDDPVKKAELIKDMVESIAKIPDAIKRQLFLQKAAQIMAVAEDLLLAEANRHYLKKRNDKVQNLKQNQENNNQTTNNQQYNEQEPSTIPDGNYARPDNLYIQERECMRLLLNYGNIKPDTEAPEYTMAHYFMDELEGVNFTTEVYQLMLNEFRSFFSDGKIIDSSHFHSSSNEQLATEAIGLAIEKYSISENWLAMHEIHVPDEVEKITEMAYTNILRLKKVHNKIQLKKLKTALAEPKNAEQEVELLKELMAAKSIEKEIATKLGVVVLK